MAILQKGPKNADSPRPEKLNYVSRLKTHPETTLISGDFKATVVRNDTRNGVPEACAPLVRAAFWHPSGMREHAAADRGARCASPPGYLLLSLRDEPRQTRRPFPRFLPPWWHSQVARVLGVVELVECVASAAMPSRSTLRTPSKGSSSELRPERRGCFFLGD